MECGYICIITNLPPTDTDYRNIFYCDPCNGDATRRSHYADDEDNLREIDDGSFAETGFVTSFWSKYKTGT